MSALDRAQEEFVISFDQPKTCIQGGILKTQILLPVTGVSTCAIHPRVGMEASPRDDEALLEGTFFPLTTSNVESFSCSRQWTALALARILRNGQQGIHVILIPLGPSQSFVLSRYLAIPEGFIVKEVGFYGDDGKSTLFSGEESGYGKEVRQAIGLLLENSSEQAFWLIPYDQVRFEVITTSQNLHVVDICGLDIPISSVVHVHPKSDESEGNENSDLLYARSTLVDVCGISQISDDPLTPSLLSAARCVQTNVDEIVESRLLLCGSRGVGGVVSCNENRANTLALFDLEEDEEHDEESEGESMRD